MELNQRYKLKQFPAASLFEKTFKREKCGKERNSKKSRNSKVHQVLEALLFDSKVKTRTVEPADKYKHK